MSHLDEVLFVYVLFHHLFSHLKWYRSLEATLIQRISAYTLHPTVVTQAFVLHQHFKCTWKKATITELDLLMALFTGFKMHCAVKPVYQCDKM